MLKLSDLVSRVLISLWFLYFSDCYQVKAPSIEDAMHILIVNGKEFMQDLTVDTKVARRLRMFIKLIRAKDYKCECLCVLSL